MMFATKKASRRSEVSQPLGGRLASLGDAKKKEPIVKRCAALGAALGKSIP
jgi:hypothetical protein